MKKERILLRTIYAAGIAAFAVFTITKSEWLMDLATSRMYDDGDLYRFAKVLPFKTTLPAPLCTVSAEHDQDSDPDTASVIIIGDSFMETCRGHNRFPLDCAAQLGVSVYPEYALEEQECFDPVYFCWKNSLDPDRKRVILLERIERYIVNDYDHALGRTLDTVRQREESRLSWLGTIKRRWFTNAEKNYEVFLTSSDITSPLIELWNTMKFAALGQISEQTPRYSLHPPFLFEKEEVDPAMPSSYYFPHPDSLIEEIADNIAEARQMLLDRYGAELVFMPVPNAFTLYHSFVTDDSYDAYLPRLCAALEERGVRTVNLYDRFRASSKVLYFPTDTHWNPTGEALAVDEASRVLTPLLPKR